MAARRRQGAQTGKAGDIVERFGQHRHLRRAMGQRGQERGECERHRCEQFRKSIHMKRFLGKAGNFRLARNSSEALMFKS